MDQYVSLTIDGMKIKVEKGTSILKAAEQLHITIPTLCYHEDLCTAGNCRVCVVEIENEHLLKASCCSPVAEGMSILTNSVKVRIARKDILSLLLSEHNDDCHYCVKNNRCELQKMTSLYDIENRRWINLVKDTHRDISSPSIEKDDQKCIKCQRCVRTCGELQEVNALTVVNRGGALQVSTFLDKPLHDVLCTNCGQCVNRCPTGALTEKSSVQNVWKALDDKSKYVVVQIAPSIRASIGEFIGESAGLDLNGQLVSFLKRIGFNAVFDTSFAADLAIVEESADLLERMKKAYTEKVDVKVPMFTSCSPGWVKYIEHNFPDMLDNLSSCKSPQQMLGTLIKTYYADRKALDPGEITVVSIMPCTAKKFENSRPEMNDSGYKDVDYVLTTRELGRMISETGINLPLLDKSECDSLFGAYSGAGLLSGSTGGVLHATLRTVYEMATGQNYPFDSLSILPEKSSDGIREVTVPFNGCIGEWSFLNGMEVKAAAVDGLKKAGDLVRKIHNGTSFYHFVEVMACPDGCLGGGGQPIPTTSEIRDARSKVLHRADISSGIRKSHDNPDVIKLYENYLGEPGGAKSEKILHTTYKARSLK